MCVSVLIAHKLGVFKGSQVNAIHQVALVILLLFWTYKRKNGELCIIPGQMDLILWDTSHLPILLIL